MNSTIRKALGDRATLSFTYKGKQRWVEPHTYGIQLNGNEALSAWQIAGGSGADFRLFIVGEMSGVHLGETFDGERPGYHRGDQRFQIIYAEL